MTATSSLHTHCRICNSTSLVSFLTNGKLPLANAYVVRDALDQPEFREEVVMQVCADCGLSQLSKVVHPDQMFETYLYASSVSSTFRTHCAELAQTVAELVKLNSGDTVLDIASNDGCLLREFSQLGAHTVGVEPAKNLAKQANEAGLFTLNSYWSEAIGLSFKKRKIVTATNVLGHVDDVHDFVAGVAHCLADNGVFVIEVPYVLDLLENVAFDTAYHEHLSYFAVAPLRKLLQKHGLDIFDVGYFPRLHGGTIRAYVCWRLHYPTQPSVHEFLSRELRAGLIGGNTEMEPYYTFCKNANATKWGLLALLKKLQRAGKRVWAYGASAKGTTLLNAILADASLIEAVVDDTPTKQGLFLPGLHVEIVGGIDALPADVDYLVLLAWNFKEELIANCQQAGYRGQFIIPIPEPVIV